MIGSEVCGARFRMFAQRGSTLSKLRSRLRALQQDPEQNSNQEKIILRLFKDKHIFRGVWGGTPQEEGGS